MALRTLSPQRSDRSQQPTWRRDTSEDDHGRGRVSRALLVALVLACVTLMVVDHTGGEDSPVSPVRRVVGEVLGPAEAFATAAASPLLSLRGAARTNASLREDVAALEEDNAQLQSALRGVGYDERRVTELRNLRAVAGDLGYALLPARVVAIGPAQSFSDTVTIDAGSDAGLRPDMTVLAADGLVGRITRVTGHTATVRLVVDSDVTVGGRVGDSMELGFVHGRGGVAGDARLDLELVDETVVPRRGETVVTWGSEGGAPFVAGVPIGEVTEVYESLRETSYRAVLRPYVDFSSLDLVGVVVPSGTESERPVIEADETVRMP